MGGANSPQQRGDVPTGSRGSNLGGAVSGTRRAYPSSTLRSHTSPRGRRWSERPATRPFAPTGEGAGRRMRAAGSIAAISLALTLTSPSPTNTSPPATYSSQETLVSTLDGIGSFFQGLSSFLSQTPSFGMTKRKSAGTSSARMVCASRRSWPAQPDQWFPGPSSSAR